jgi:thioredoxin-like negative regulator of GroEL
VEKLAERYAGRVSFAKLNVDEAPETAAAYGISSIPTIALFRDGQPVTGVLGAVPESQLSEMIDEHLPAQA